MMMPSALSIKFSMSLILELQEKRARHATFRPKRCEKCRKIVTPGPFSARFLHEMPRERPEQGPHLSLILAPPTIATRGRWGLVNTCEKAFNSFSISKPATCRRSQVVIASKAFSGSSQPTIDECARCAVPKASFT